jgi:hypothetical protein
MCHIAKHYSKQEREGDCGEESRIDLAVTWNTVSVNDLLKDIGEFVAFEISWWFLVSWLGYHNLSIVLVLVTFVE